MIKQGSGCKGRQQDERASSDVCSSSDNLGVEAGWSFMLRNLLPEGSGANGPWARWVGSPMMQAALDGRLLQVQPLQPLNFRPQSFSTVKRGGTWMCTADDHRRAVKVRFASKMIFFPGLLLSSCQLPVDSNTAKEASDWKRFRVPHGTKQKNLTDIWFIIMKVMNTT